MDKELVAHIVEHVKLASGGECDASSAAGMLRLELLVHEYLVRLGRETVQSLATEAGTGYQGQRVKRGKVVYRFKGNRPKTVHGLYGTVTVQRAVSGQPAMPNPASERCPDAPRADAGVAPETVPRRWIAFAISRIGHR